MKSLKKDIDEWKELVELQDNHPEHARCPKCKEEFAFCDCPQLLAHEILGEIVKRNIPIEDDDKKPTVKI